MAPIHDTDIAEERYAQAQWQYYELWEKIEVRLRRRKWLWIAATAAVFMVLSSIPILIDRWPKWSARVAARKLAQEVGQVKLQASISGKAYRIRFAGGGSLAYSIEALESCASAQPPVLVREGSLALGGATAYLLTSAQGEQLGIPALVESFCYDPLEGNRAVKEGRELVGFGIIPGRDLGSESVVNPLTTRMDRISVLLLRGESAEISFD